ncbi:MAG: iron export ABC transporter permease subunit FetB [Gammaproteobacteria bacterium]|nr:iron export ABC transporter permease subunit FetB [Gammaproteobacteria bacterium]NIR98226.1 iron export ABC transporter permease subunit FetB [Gammaproteobacteria bacterium]NIT63897.1 iron export ABC transporter permease subunit FetB [Gammaproteobacteria bacterium]NIV20901.1 iron export ABC transporter permease subunit FetB [Gammaproteobacteria bacterium]NIY32477.1 iron export ABC transporter permease subunit FetB [Gammaproteobacteria bacterium]
MTLISLTPLDLSLAAVLVAGLAGLSLYMRLGLHGRIVVAALRTTVQLLLIGLVLKAIFAYVHLGWITLIALAMLGVAGREVMARQRYRFAGWWGFGLGTLAMFVSSFAVTVLALTVIVRVDPWYTPQYAIPLLGMLLGNTMNGIALGMDRLTQTARQQRAQIEARLMLGETWDTAIGDIRHDSTRTGLIPIINAMAAAGVVSLPGMMTGQILAGAAPVEAVKYQILIMFLIAAGTGFGTLCAVHAASKRLFDERQRLRLDRLQSPGHDGR